MAHHSARDASGSRDTDAPAHAVGDAAIDAGPCYSTGVRPKTIRVRGPWGRVTSCTFQGALDAPRALLHCGARNGVVYDRSGALLTAEALAQLAGRSEPVVVSVSPPGRGSMLGVCAAGALVASYTALCALRGPAFRVARALAIPEACNATTCDPVRACIVAAGSGLNIARGQAQNAVPALTGSVDCVSMLDDVVWQRGTRALPCAVVAALALLATSSTERWWVAAVGLWFMSGAWSSPWFPR